MASAKKTIFILIISALFASIFFVSIAYAQNEGCNVVNVKIRTSVFIPDGDDEGSDNQEEFNEEFMDDESPPFVYFDIQTTGCVDVDNDGDFKLSLEEMDVGGDDEVNGSEDINGNEAQSYLDDYEIEVDTNNFTLVYLAGEDECESAPGFLDCDYEQVLTNDGDDLLFAEEWQTLIRQNENNQPVASGDGSSPSSGDGLAYECDATCDEDWIYIATIDYGDIDPQDSSGTVPATATQTVGSTDYLAPLPGLENKPQTLPGFLEGLFQVLIVIAGLLAMIMLVIGGITYLSTDAFSGKTEGKEMMLNAVFGLVLALGGWVIMNTINPNLASNLAIRIPKVHLDAPRAEWQNGNAPVGTNIAEGVTVNNQPVTQGGAWPSDAPQRAQLAGAGITVHASGDAAQSDGVADCTEGAGTPNCTSVYFEGAAASVIQQIIDFKTACSAALAAMPNPIPCVVKITGGSEAWLHVSHGPSKKVVDMSATPSLNRYLNSLPGGPPEGDNFPGGKTVIISGVGKFHAEGSGDNVNTTAQHWHVRFY